MKKLLTIICLSIFVFSCKNKELKTNVIQSEIDKIPRGSRNISDTNDLDFTLSKLRLLLIADSFEFESEMAKKGIVEAKGGDIYSLPKIIEKNKNKLNTIGIGMFFMEKIPSIIMIRDDDWRRSLFYTFPICKLSFFKTAILSDPLIVAKAPRLTYSDKYDKNYVYEECKGDYMNREINYTFSYFGDYCTLWLNIAKETK